MVIHIVLLKYCFIFALMRSEVVTFKASEHFRAHIEQEAKKKGIKTGTFIKAVLKKYTKYKENEKI
jgi:predicted DNA binding CopG/RHH family protein